MNGETPQAREESAAVYLQQLQALAAEMQVSMNAISCNSLATLEESVAKQEMICNTLVAMTKAMGDSLKSRGQSIPHCADDAVEFKIMTTSATIRALNLQYASLLKHSGRSINLLASLCRSHTGQIREDRRHRLKHQTWSCEM